MKVTPHTSGGLEITIVDSAEWFLLNSIVQDAVGQGDDWLAQQLSEPMDDESCWDDIVVPELQTKFSDQLNDVRQAIGNAFQEQKNDGEATLQIKREQAWSWYGALNQARLALEEEHHVSDLDEDDLEDLPPSLMSVLGRSQFYLWLQSNIFAHCIEESEDG